MGRRLTVSVETYPLSAPFVIARGAKTIARQIAVTLESDGKIGRGAAVPYARYGESLDGAAAALNSLRTKIETGLNREGLLDAMPPSAARAALDAALFDLEAQLTGVPAHEIAGLSPPAPVTTALTLTVAEPQATAARATALRDAPLLKMKLAGDGLDAARLSAVLGAAPDARLILDANEGLDRNSLERLLDSAPAERIALIEQPLRAGADQELAGLTSAIPLYADESFHGASDLPGLKGLYQGVNVKLEKAGGLTAALSAVIAARAEGFNVMLGCMVASSLALAPAFLLAPLVDVVDLDGALFLAADDEDGVVADGARLIPPRLWGTPR